MVGRVFIAILALVIFLGFTPVISKGIHNMRTEELTKTQEVVTDPGETEADIVLSPELYRDLISEVNSISSTIEESPAAGAYDADTDTLTVSNLTDDTTRTLTIKYYAELDDEYMKIIGPFLTFLIFGGVIGALIWGVWRRR